MEVKGERKKYNAIDLTKFIMAIFVIAVHTYPLVGINNTIVLDVYKSIVYIAVPFFFIVSSYFLFMKVNKFDEDKGKEIIILYIKKMIKLYIIWNIIFLPMAIYEYNKEGYSLVKSVMFYIRGFLLVGEHYYSWPLWYLLSTIYSAIFILVLKKKNIKEKNILIISTVIFILACMMNYLSDNISKLEGISYNIAFLINLTFSSGRIFTGMFYMSIGMYFSNHKENLPKSVLIIVFIFALIFSSYYYNDVCEAIMGITIFLIVRDIDLKDKKIYYFLRKSSTIMYFMHMIFFFIYSLFVGFDVAKGLDGFFVSLVSCVIFSIIIQAIQNKYNFTFFKEIFG